MATRPHFLIEKLEHRWMLDGLSDDAAGPLELCDVHPARLASSDATDSQPASIYLASVFDHETVPPASYSVTIDWGDGTISAGRVVGGSDGELPKVFGDHEYTSTGTYDMIVIVRRHGIDASTATFVHVFDAHPIAEIVSVPGDPWIVMSSQPVDSMPGAVEMPDTNPLDPPAAGHRMQYASAAFVSPGLPTIAVGLFQDDRRIMELD